MQSYMNVFVVMRTDRDVARQFHVDSDTGGEANALEVLSVPVKVYKERDAALAEAERLNDVNSDKNVVYHVQHSKLF
jgi:hypothetical protein